MGDLRRPGGSRSMDLDPLIIDERIDSQAAQVLPPAIAATSIRSDDLRRHAREVLSIEIEAVRRLVQNLGRAQSRRGHAGGLERACRPDHSCLPGFRHLRFQTRSPLHSQPS